MNLRLKLLFIFVAGELLLLGFFGYIAYDSAKNSNINNEIRLLSRITPHVVERISADISNNKSLRTTLSSASGTTTKHEEEIFVLVSDQVGTLLVDVKNPRILEVYNRISKELSNQPELNSGKFSIHDSVFVWSQARLPVEEYQLTLLKRAHASHAAAFFNQMGVSLIIAAVIMLWVASWAAMYISMLMEKLNKQKNILRHRSLHDVLTGLPNRALFNDRLQQLIGMRDRSDIQFAVCFIDLNRFKDVNDTLGHHVGDQLLLEVSKRIKSSLRKVDTVARLGGDEFAIIVKSVSTLNARNIAEKMLQEIEAPIYVAGHKLFVSGSMGIALFPEHGDEINTLLKNADVAMYAAKRSGAQLEFYAHSQEVFTAASLELTRDLRESIEGDQLELHYQPKFDITTKSIVGVEALLRWNHATRGYIPPLEFIPLAEHSGLTRALSRWVLHRVFDDFSTLRRYGSDLSVSINLSALYLQDLKFEMDIHELLVQHNIDASSIILELTESAMFVNYGKTNELLKRLTSLGFRISVDDFGTGYSTLTNLRRLPISELKIDRTFVDRIVTNMEDASIVNAMIGLGRSLNIDVVAEGVESEEVMEALRQFGCTTIQGHLISKAVPLSDLGQCFESQNSAINTAPSLRSIK